MNKKNEINDIEETLNSRKLYERANAILRELDAMEVALAKERAESEGAQYTASNKKKTERQEKDCDFEQELDYLDDEEDESQDISEPDDDEYEEYDEGEYDEDEEEDEDDDGGEAYKDAEEEDEDDDVDEHEEKKEFQGRASHESLRKSQPKRLARNANCDRWIFFKTIRRLAFSKIQNMAFLVSIPALMILMFVAMTLTNREDGFLNEDTKEIVELSSNYYTALLKNDIKALSELSDAVDGKEQDAKVEDLFALRDMEYILKFFYEKGIFESLKIQDCKLQSGLQKGEYIVYCQCEIGFKDVSTTAPGITVLYVVEEKDGKESKYRVSAYEAGSEREKYIQERSQESEVRKLMDETNAALEAACKKDENLKTVVDTLKNSK